MRYHKTLVSCIFFFAFLTNVICEISLPDILSDGMVLQRHTSIPIWGMADPEEEVSVQFGDQVKKSVADNNGKWHIDLDPMAANSSPQSLIIRGRSTITLNNILVGEVWLCSGQSNMQWEVQQSIGGEQAIAEADYPSIRLFNVSRDVGFKKKEGKLATWKAADPQSVKRFSGVGYFFAVDLYKRLGVPVGMINSSYGGTQAEAWTPRSYLRVPDLQPCIDREITWAAERDQVRLDYDKRVVAWKIKAEKAKAAGTRVPGKPRVPSALRPQRIAGSIYTNMIEPLIPYRIKGAIWYQGESNAERSEQYELLLSTMIRSWRDRWDQGDFPFSIVQLPNFRDKVDTPQDEAWSHVRDRQLKVAQKTNNTGLVVTIDIGKAHDIHPANKIDVSKRIIAWAMSTVYGQKKPYQGPLFDHIKFKKGKAIICFKETSKGLKTTDGTVPKDFAIAGSDKEWVWAKAKIKGKKKIIVWSEEISEPVAVRYAFNNNPNNANLTNETGIPASPFRTDNWPGPKAGIR